MTLTEECLNVTSTKEKSMFKISESDHVKITTGLRELNLNKISFCDFVRFKEQRAAEVKKGFEDAMADLEKKQSDLLKKITDQEEKFRMQYQMIFDNAVPADYKQKEKLQYDEKNFAFVNPDEKKPEAETVKEKEDAVQV